MFTKFPLLVVCLTISGIWAVPIPEAKPVDVGPGVEDKMTDVLAAPLWSKGGPVVGDSAQGSGDGGCWLHATLAALVNHDNKLITDIVKDIGIGNGEEGADTDEAEIKLVTSEGKEKKFKVKRQSSIGGSSDGKENWWHAAIRRGVMTMGAYTGVKENSLDGGWWWDAFKMLTGKTAAKVFQPSKDDVWRFAKISKDAPIVLSTRTKTSRLTNLHVYTVMSYEGDGADNLKLEVRDPYEDQGWYKLENIIDEIADIGGLEELAN